MSFRCLVYYKSQIKRFLYLNITKKLAKENSLLTSTSKRTHPFFLWTHKNKPKQMVENIIKIIQSLTYFSDVLRLFFLLLVYINITSLLRELMKQLNNETVSLWLKYVKHQILLLNTWHVFYVFMYTFDSGNCIVFSYFGLC